MIRIDRTYVSLTNGRAVATNTQPCRCFITGFFPHTTQNHTTRRAIEGCGSCLQEPANESDIVVVVVEFVFIVVDGLQGLQVELVPE